MKLSYNAKLSLIALLLVLCTLFTSCNTIGTQPITTDTTLAETTAALTTPDGTTPEDSTPEDTTPDATTPDVITTTERTPEEITTPAPAETTTEAPAETTTEAPVETTTEAPAETTTEPVCDTTPPAETTTEAPAETTTEAPVETTTEAPTETTTEAPEETTPPEETTTPEETTAPEEIVVTYIVDGISYTSENEALASLPEGAIFVQWLEISPSVKIAIIEFAETTSPEAEPEIPALSMPSFDIDSIPEYSFKPFTEVNGNVPFFTENQLTTESYEYYSALDKLGRCGITVACIGRDIMPTEARGDISSVKPTGWVQAMYDGSYLYNRCHLIGFQLTGENANKQNLITGTAYFNVTGMLAFENMVADYIKETNNHVLYRVTPIFVGNELVARGVLMEAWSVEDDGEGICFNVFVYNVQPGVEIDYATGKSQEAESTPSVPEGEKNNYIANKNSKKFHVPTCTWVTKMSESNKEYHTSTYDEMIANGYSPCGTCNP